MNTRALRAAVGAFLLFSLTEASAFDVTSVSLHLYLSGLKAASGPVVVEDHLVLSARGSYRYVGAAFSYEDWRSVHSFELNRNGVFVLAVPLPYGQAKTVQYRMVIDGLWTADPGNPRVERDAVTGVAMSVASFPERPETVLGVWNPAGEGHATFYFEAEPGRRVTVAGSFNGWDPFIHDLAEVAPGRYELTLDLPAGEYYYVFIYKGERVTDPLNVSLAYDSRGRAVSALVVREP